MKVGIITITNGQNYGNRLQNYALQESIKKLGHEPETIWNNTGAWENLGLISRTKYWIRSKLKIKYTPRVERVVKFNAFNKKYIIWSQFFVESGKVPENLKNQYDYFVCGSDQVWNPCYERTSGIDFLTFADKKQKIAYAPCIGVDKISEEQKQKLKIYLNNFCRISVREQKGADILEDLLDRKIPVMPDPTILLTKEQWNLLQIKPHKIKNDEKFILTYFLGENSKAMRDAEQLAKYYGCKIISLEDCYTDGRNNPYFITMDPGEFLWLIAHAKYILTDSFHGCVFSILYEKHFIVYPRENKLSLGSRIEQLLKTYHLENHMSTDHFETDRLILEEDVNKSGILEEERRRGFEFLENSFGKQAIN